MRSVKHPQLNEAKDGLLPSLDGKKWLGLRRFMGNIHVQIMRKL
jgi:hypothetical protein